MFKVEWTSDLRLLFPDGAQDDDDSVWIELAVRKEKPDSEIDNAILMLFVSWNEQSRCICVGKAMLSESQRDWFSVFRPVRTPWYSLRVSDGEPYQKCDFFNLHNWYHFCFDLEVIGRREDQGLSI
jgi:hypothetical protein